jgi:hypothetical protein
LLVGFDDGAEFVRQATALAETPERIREIGAVARESAERLAWSRVVDQFEILLLAAAGAQSGALSSVVDAAGGDAPVNVVG